MPEVQRIEFARQPSLALSLMRGTLRRERRVNAEQSITPLDAQLDRLRSTPAAVARYARVCGFRPSRYLPFTYPHVLAFPLQMAVMSDGRFPLRLIGLIHIRNRIVQHRRIACGEALNLTVSVGGHREAAKGVEFDLVSRFVDMHGEPVWDETGVLFARQATDTIAQEKSSPSKRYSSRTFAERVDIPLPGDIGRQYARVAGDINPFHLAALPARLFGFNRAIAHGMWMKARFIALLEPRLSGVLHSADVACKTPAYIPTRARFAYTLDDESTAIGIANARSDVPHLIGTLNYRSANN